MDAKATENFVQMIRDCGNRYLFMGYQILSNHKQFFNSRNLETTEEFIAASKFSAFVSILNLMIALPYLRSSGVQVENSYFIIIDTVIAYAFFFLSGAIFHITAKLLLCKGSLQGSVTVFLYLTAFMPVLSLLSIPLGFALHGPLTRMGGSISPEFALQFVEHNADNLLLQISFLVAMGFCVFYLKVLCSGYRIQYAVGRIRAFSIVFMGSIGLFVTSVYIVNPVNALFHKSFQQEARDTSISLELPDNYSNIQNH